MPETHRIGGVEVVVLPVLEDNYVYVLIVGDTAAVIDPAEAAPVLQLLKDRKCRLTHILVTHSHYDHVAGVSAVKSATSCKVVGPRDGTPELDQAVGEGDRITVGSCEIHVIDTAGHGREHVSFYAPGPGILWSGDTLFVAGCGRIMGCQPDVLWKSLQKLAALPDETQIFCGHEYTVENLRFAATVEPDNVVVRGQLRVAQLQRKEGKPTVPSTIGMEKRTNPFIRAPDAATFAERRRRKDVF